jgi:hypothetical protein
MALITGKDCDLTIATKDYKDVVNTFSIAFETSPLEYQTLGGPRAAGGSETGSLSITFAYDSGDADSLYDALWTAAGTSIAYIATVGAATFTGNAIAVRPSATATAGEISEVTVELTLDGIPVKGAKTRSTASGTTTP